MYTGTVSYSAEYTQYYVINRYSIPVDLLDGLVSVHAVKVELDFVEDADVGRAERGLVGDRPAAQ